MQRVQLRVIDDVCVCVTPRHDSGNRAGRFSFGTLVGDPTYHRLRRGLVDFSGLTERLAERGFPAARDLARVLAADERAFGGARIALVAELNVNYGISHAIREFTAAFCTDVEVFRTVELALEWLGADDDHERAYELS